MSYATIDDVFGRYRPIETNVGTGDYDVPSVDVSSIFIRQAEGLVDAYLSQRYVVPLDTTSLSPLITRITADIAIYDMIVDKLPEVPDFASARYTNAIDLLKMFQAGTLSLPGATEATTDGGNYEAWSTTQDYHPVFSPVLRPEDQRVDHDRVDDDKDARVDDGGGTLGARFNTPCL